MKDKLYWEFRRSRELNYEYSTIHIFVGHPHTLKERIERVKDDHQGGDIGRLTASYQQRIDQGYKFVIDRGYKWVTFKWLHYRGSQSRHYQYPRDYCQPQIILGGYYHDIKRNVKLMNRIIKMIMKMQSRDFVTSNFLTPKTVIAALKRIKAKPVEQKEYTYYRRAA